MTTWQAGLARRDITAYEPGMALLGWGQLRHRAQGVGARLFARALLVRDTKETVAIVTLDLCFVPQLLRAAILDALAARPVDGLTPGGLLLLATHTHAGPSGITDSVLYGAMSFGVAPGVLRHITEAVIEALHTADRCTFPASLRLGTATLPPGPARARQRSPHAWRANPEAHGRHPDDSLEPTVTALRIDDDQGRERGMLGVIASHATLIHPDLPLLHPDHPGVTAARLEERHHHDLDYVALIAQAGAGDATPNTTWNPTRRLFAGPTGDALIDAALVGEALADTLTRASEAAAHTAPLTGPVRARTRHVDLSRTWLPPVTASGPPRQTQDPCLGMAFPIGTDEGPGPFGAVAPALLALHRLRARLWRARGRTGDIKLVFGPLERGLHGRLFGLLSAATAARAPHGDPVLTALGALDRAGLPVDRPWVPCVLPATTVQLGGLILGAVAGEPTTVAAARLRTALAHAAGTPHALLLGYAGAYTGYITTREEYEVQAYEGGHTLFGPWTLAAWEQTLIETVGQPWSQAIPGPPPVVMPMDVLVKEREVMRASLTKRYRWLVGGTDVQVR
jgi:neutral ceramidase